MSRVVGSICIYLINFRVVSLILIAIWHPRASVHCDTMLLELVALNVLKISHKRFARDPHINQYSYQIQIDLLDNSTQTALGKNYTPKAKLDDYNFSEGL